MNIRTEAPQLDLLTLARLDSQWIGIHPLVCRNVCRFRRVRKNVEYRRLIDDREECDGRHDLLQNIPDFGLYLGFRFGRGAVANALVNGIE